jgi:peptidase M48-like protein
MTRAVQAKRWRQVAACSLAVYLVLPQPCPAATKMKLRGYITKRVDDRTLAILDDKLELTTASRITGQDAAGEHAMTMADLGPGMLLEAEGQWLDRHKFFAEKVTVDLKDAEKQIHGAAYLQEEPGEAGKISGGEAAALKADGYWLDLTAQTRREWDAVKVATSSTAGSGVASKDQALAGYQVKYNGVRRNDGRIGAERIELGAPAPTDAYKMPHDVEVVPAKDPLTGIDVIEFRHGNKVQGRMKLFPVRSVQEYVTTLGDSLLPQGNRGTSKALEFRFFVVEDSSINAASLPDGTLLINTALLGAIQNEAQLSFVLSHEIAHVLQVHYWREVHETRGQRVGLVIAGLAAGAFIGDLGTFLAGIGIASVVNGHQRELENQADRLGLQNVIEHGYDPREAPKFCRMIIERYGDRSTSKVWSNHDSSLMRGSFLTVQLMRQYPESQFEQTKRDSSAFRAMREAMGPVKIE